MLATTVLFHKRGFSPIIRATRPETPRRESYLTVTISQVRHIQGDLSMRRMVGFVIGIFIGGLVGSTVALLLAPGSGAELRGQLRARGEGLLAEVRDAADTRRAELTDRLQALRAPRTSTSELT